MARLYVTPRQEEILRSAALGHSDKQIADLLGISHATVRTHLRRLYLSYGFKSRSQAVAAWLGHDPAARAG